MIAIEQLDEDDRDWVSLLSHLVAAGREHDQGFAPTTAAMLGEMAEIVRRSGLGMVVSPDSVEKIAGSIQELWSAGATGALERSPDQAYISTFERPKLAEQLAGVLDSAIGVTGVEGERV